ncbi:MULTISPECIES: ABC transporter ATP-binding protein [Rhodobacterales]|uniref:ABC transporter ATP-binding protein n=1 Tax=Rhodobacterales TaxID=204455 RepID=UPI00237FB9BA|nr:ABC transporter ATP-binding protein [Phaeobacter gallaeciensis]MDE4142674.1 ABC transporter ATP-binding protein [Phaeobacter gallaeciensis]MDE4151119.1 ABC transporter ATP-binding protein [Phaeobacter gallaeciensis]MDE4155385.1 ABC transporter ATP-binding protein [Phaeobacter gallaeciensis]MDE4230776.1 ABC transporter ATP-binding protein [Phaeobacter gallaeciensis]MDE4259816.1 ABC transporter ATP-binding protein [Phaeobacter gallaeciensis]
MTRIPLLSVENLRLNFGSHEAVKGISFEIAKGETLALVGESGSGKSATALALLRLIEREGGQIAGGTVTLHGTPDLQISALSDRQMQQVRGNRVSMIFQEPMTALNPVMSLGDQVAEVLQLHQDLDAAAARAAARDAFEQVKIPEAERRLDQFPHELSGGLRQRVMIAMALACRPDLLIADEPTTALDVTTQAEILTLIRQLQEEIGTAVLFITHDMGVVANIADRVVVLKQGDKVEEGPVAEIFSRPEAAYTQQLMAATPKLGSGAPKPLLRPTSPVLEVENLAVRFPVRRGVLPGGHLDYHAVNGVSLSIAPGETLGLVGESGCGKSTLARAVLRLVEPSQGRIRLEGQEITGLNAAEMRPLRQRAQMVFQDPFASLNPRMSVRDLITEPAHIHQRLSRRERRALARELLQKVGLEPAAADRFPHQFSGGQRQRLCIARALSVSPALIVADESVSALDVSVARQVTDLMARLQAEDGVSFLFISHDIAVVERVSHRVAVMWAGQIVETGPTEAVLHNPQHPYTQRLLAAVPVADLSRHGPQRPQLPAVQPPKLLLTVGHVPERSKMREVSPDHYVAVQNPAAPLLSARPKHMPEQNVTEREGPPSTRTSQFEQV